jgi:hypothetical protein
LAEGAALEMRYTASSGIEGSNPSRSGFACRIKDLASVCDRNMADLQGHFSQLMPMLMPIDANRRMGGDVRYTAAETAYQKALKEIAADPGDAIIDAARALQEMLTALGCEGNSLGPLLTSARKKGLLGPYDYKLLDVVAKAIDWVSAGSCRGLDPADRRAVGVVTHEAARPARSSSCSRRERAR